MRDERYARNNYFSLTNVSSLLSLSLSLYPPSFGQLSYEIDQEISLSDWRFESVLHSPSTRNRFSSRPYLFICRLSRAIFLHGDTQFPAKRSHQRRVFPPFSSCSSHMNVLCSVFHFLSLLSCCPQAPRIGTLSAQSIYP